MRIKDIIVNGLCLGYATILIFFIITVIAMRGGFLISFVVPMAGGMYCIIIYALMPSNEVEGEGLSERGLGNGIGGSESDKS